MKYTRITRLSMLTIVAVLFIQIILIFYLYKRDMSSLEQTLNTVAEQSYQSYLDLRIEKAKNKEALKLSVTTTKELKNDNSSAVHPSLETLEIPKLQV